jgi:hypothetical protein
VGGIVLTSQEKRIILFLVLAFLIGVTVKIYREHHPATPVPRRGHTSVIANPPTKLVLRVTTGSSEAIFAAVSQKL